MCVHASVCVCVCGCVHARIRACTFVVEQHVRICSAQCVDSKSLARLGVYVARGSEARSFVNTAPAQRGT